MTTTESPDTEVSSARPSKAMEIAFASVALALSSAYLLLGTQIELRREAAAGQIDARFWPLMLGTAAVAVAVLLLVIAITRPAPGREDVEPIQPGGMVRVAGTAILTIAYVATWSISSIVMLGYRYEIFPFATAVYMVLLMLLFGHRKWLSLVLYPVIVTAFIYVVFGMLLRVPL